MAGVAVPPRNTHCYRTVRCTTLACFRQRFLSRSSRGREGWIADVRHLCSAISARELDASLRVSLLQVHPPPHRLTTHTYPPADQPTHPPTTSLILFHGVLFLSPQHIEVKVPVPRLLGRMHHPLPVRGLAVPCLFLALLYLAWPHFACPVVCL